MAFDGVFIGPSDLAADMGLVGQLDSEAVIKAILGAVEKTIAAGKAAGILTMNAELQTQCRALGASYIATEIDVTLFASAIREAAKRDLKHLQATS